MILAKRSWPRTILSKLKSPATALCWVLSGATVFLALVLYAPFLQQFFRFSAPRGADLALALAVGAVSIVWFETIKLLYKRR